MCNSDYISSTHEIATQEVVKIKQRFQNSTSKDGHNSTKINLIMIPGRYSIGGFTFQKN